MTATLSLPTAAMLLLDMAFVGLLPRLFFRRDGSYNLMWFVTAAPFFAAPVFIALQAAGIWTPIALGGPEVRTALEVASLPLVAGSIALIAFTIGTHRVPLSLWHQENDAPKSIVTYGAYARIRHPFYASFLLGLLAVVLAAPHASTIATLVYGFVILDRTAAREEARLSSSAFGAEYRAYVARTGRFFPRPFSSSAPTGAASAAR